MRYLLIVIFFLTGLPLAAQGDFGHLSEPDEPIIPVTVNNEGGQQSEELDTILQENQDTIVSEPLISEIEESETFNVEAVEKSNHKAVFETFAFYLICISILGFLLIYIFYPIFFKSIYRSIFDNRQSNIVFEELSYRENLPLSLMLANSILVYSVALVTLFYYFNPTYFAENYMLIWMVILLIVFVLIIAKQGLLQLLSVIMPFKQVLSLYNFNIQIVTIFTSFVLLMAMSLLVFGQLSIVKVAIIVSLWFVFQVFRAYRGLLVARQKIIIHPFYFFLYLCTLEISPLLILYKIAESLNGQVV